MRQSDNWDNLRPTNQGNGSIGGSWREMPFGWDSTRPSSFGWSWNISTKPMAVLIVPKTYMHWLARRIVNYT